MTDPRPATQFFLFKLLAPRPSFAQDMNEQERAVMLEHVAYWKGHADRGVAVVFGPVLDPKGTWGVGIVEVGSEAEILALQAGDPAIKGGIGLQYETYPMARAIVRKG